MILALYAFQVLPVNFAGVGLMLLGLALMIGEGFMPSFGFLGIGGAIAFVIGSVILIDTDDPAYGVSMPLILAFALVSALTLILLVGMALKSRRRPVVSGAEELIGAVGQALVEFDDKGSVRVHGELWDARTDTPLKKGQPIRVRGRKGLTLMVTAGQQERD